jgi:hypothetical protein
MCFENPAPKRNIGHIEGPPKSIDLATFGRARRRALILQALVRDVNGYPFDP